MAILSKSVCENKLNTTTNICVKNACVLCSLLYGSETWTLYDRQEHHLFNKRTVYMATVNTETNTSSYVGMTGNNFKTVYYNHLKSFKNIRHKNETELSRYIWKI